ncbi:MAG: hypothetical protein KC493_02020 [Bacteriovoracaceae bacterium]|nr:hypothetical protein [Bacteriovoracaceae bacterium]
MHTLFLSLLFLYSSCASNSPWRLPAADEINDLPVKASELLSINSSSDKIDSSHLSINPKSYIESDIKSSLAKNKYLSFVFEETEEMAEGKAFRVFPEVTNDGKYLVKIFHAKGAFDDKVASLNLANFLQQIANRKYFNLYHDFFELVFNARLGDLESLNNLMKIKQASLDPNNMTFTYKKYNVTNVGFGKTLDQASFTETKLGKKAVNEEGAELLRRFNQPVLEALQQDQQKLAPLLTSQKRERKALEKTRKTLLKELDRAGDMEQLKSLAAAGKRKEVADLISTYLPKEHMTPAEKQYWETILDVMRNPLELKDRVLVFRGIDDDMVYPFIENGIELEREVAIKESKGIFMSSVMTKNQGTWNRRMRSLQTMYDKVLNQNIETGTNEFSKGARMTTMFHQHAMNPQGSPFLSWTPKIETAHMFGKERASAFLMDPRLMMANYASVFTNELELLTPLITFPDEMVAIHDQKIHGQLGASGREKLFLEKTKEKLVKEYGEEVGDEHFTTIKKIFNKHNKAASVAELTVKPEPETAFKRFFKSIRSFFDKLFKKGEAVTPPPPPPVPEKQTCTYLIESLWKAAN